MEYPRGLIRLTTQNAVTKAWKQVQVIRRIFRPRVLIYAAVLVALSAAMIASPSAMVVRKWLVPRARSQ